MNITCNIVFASFGKQVYWWNCDSSFSSLHCSEFHFIPALFNHQVYTWWLIIGESTDSSAYRPLAKIKRGTLGIVSGGNFNNLVFLTLFLFPSLYSFPHFIFMSSLYFYSRVPSGPGWGQLCEPAGSGRPPGRPEASRIFGPEIEGNA